MAHLYNVSLWQGPFEKTWCGLTQREMKSLLATEQKKIDQGTYDPKARLTTKYQGRVPD